jgi:thiamine-phosphate pyrophosphorylase
MSPRRPIRKLKLCYVTDRKALAGSAEEQKRALLDKIEGAARAGVHWIQIRDKALSGRELTALAAEALPRIPKSCRLLVNDRLDVACAVRAGGAHFGEHSLPVQAAKRLIRERGLGDDFLAGVSAHLLESAQAAEKNGADYVIFGPVFETPSKVAYGPPQGIERLAEVCGSLAIPVMAIGGITVENARTCVAAGVAGIAAIRLFQDAEDLAAVVRALREG